MRSPEVGGYGIDAQWNDDFHHALHTVLTGERDGYYADFGAFADLVKALQGAFVYDGRYSAFRRRPHGRPPTGLTGHRFLGYLQNHDQIGNRASGDRSSHLLSPGRLKVAAALVLTAPFIPLLFQGEEWGASSPFQYFTAYDDPVLGQAVATGRREEFAAFGWHPHEVPDPQADDTFARSQLHWDELAREPHAGLLDWHRHLIRLRREVPALAEGRLDRIRVSFDEEARWLVVERGPVAVACNLADRTQCVPVSMPWGTQALLTSDPAAQITTGGVTLPPDAVALLGPQSCAGVTLEPSSAVAAHGDASPPQVPILALAGEWEEVFQGEAKATLETLLPGYLQQWRWFGGKARQIRSTVINGSGALSVCLISRLLGLSLGRIRGGRAGDLCSPADHCRRSACGGGAAGVTPGHHRPGAAAGGGGAAVRGLVGSPVVGSRADGHRPQPARAGDGRGAVRPPDPGVRRPSGPG